MMDVVYESLGSIVRSFQIFLTTKDLTLGAILAMLSPFIVIWAKLSREKEKKAKAELVERRQLQIAFNVNEIMEHMGVESKWSLQEIGSTHTVPKNSNRLLTTLSKAIPVRKLILRGKKKMKEYLKKLTSRKFQSFVVGFVTQVLILLKLDVAPYVDAIAAGGLVVTTIVYIWAESSVDKSRQESNQFH